MGIALGDAGKTSSSEERFASMNLDLQFTKKKPSNEMLGELVCLAANLMGMRMSRIADNTLPDTSKQQRTYGRYRWSSERSPLLAWIVRQCLGLEKGKTTSHDEVHMDWIFGMSLTSGSGSSKALGTLTAPFDPMWLKSRAHPTQS